MGHEESPLRVGDPRLEGTLTRNARIDRYPKGWESRIPLARCQWWVSSCSQEVENAALYQKLSGATHQGCPMPVAGNTSRHDPAEMIEGRRRLIEATREASRWQKPKRRITRKETGK